VVLTHQRYGFGLQHLLAVATALVEDHPGEGEVVACGAVEAAAAHVEFRLLLQLEGIGVSDPSGPRACMPTSRVRIASLILNPVSLMPSGTNMWSRR